ncbi:MAG TPA: hypothetical protein VLZ11_04885 [Flavobacterium sp.]|nr:hypothetical protein [Flavobacterium sp.]
MKTLFKLTLAALVLTAVSCTEKKEEPVPVAPVQAAPAPAPVKAEEPKTKVDVKLNSKDGTIGVDVESKK